MEHIPLPTKIEVIPGAKPHAATISITPCYPGYGTTIGNALRRVLLSSLPGAAITAFKIKGVAHEFSTMPHVKEDVVQISLNLKQLRVKSHSEEPVRIHLRAKGQKVVTAGDIEPNSQVEISNTDLVIATLTSKDAELDMELIVNRGRGYVPTEAREKEDLEVGMIALDSLFSPIRNVGFKVESTRVGNMTNYENILLTIETDGTIEPLDAVKQSAQLMINHFGFIADQQASLGDAVHTNDESVTVINDGADEDDENETAEEKTKKRGRPKKQEA